MPLVGFEEAAIESIEPAAAACAACTGGANRTVSAAATNTVAASA